MSGQNVGRAAFILVYYNGREVTQECVASVKRMKNRDWFAVIVDNDSPDGSFAELEKEYASDGQVTVVSAGANLGFAGGTNLGIRTALEAGAGWILLLNNDTCILEPESIARMYALASKPCVGAVGAACKDTRCCCSDEHSGLLYSAAKLGVGFPEYVC